MPGPDPIIDEIRRIREEHAAEHSNDLWRIIRDYQRRQRESGRTYLTLPPRKPAPASVRESSAPYNPDDDPR